MLILLRHGRTAANARGLLQGRVDLELDDLGRRQAVAAAQWIGDVDRVISSPLQRARQTAEALGRRVEIDERFIELDYGDWEERPVRNVPADVWADWRADLDFRPPGGETLNELGARVRSALEDVAASAAGRTVVVVSHVSPIKACLAWGLGVSIDIAWRAFVQQASILRIATNGPAPSLRSFNETHHLAHLD